MNQIQEAIGIFKDELDAHPECRADLCEAAALTGTPHPHAAFYLGRIPDIEKGEGQPGSVLPPRTPEERLLDYLESACDPLKMLNPISPLRCLGKGTGTLAASFGIGLNPELDFTPEGSRILAELLHEGVPDPETSGIFPEMRDDIEVTKALTPDWQKIALPDMQGPFNIAHMVLGDDAFIAPLMQPEEWKEFMVLLTEFFISAHRTLTHWIGPERLYTHPRYYHRIAECSVNMVSKDFYLEHVLEYDQRIVDYYGDVAIHPCSGPHVFHVTLENLPNIVYTEAGNMINKMSAGSIQVTDALATIGDRPIMLSIGEELPEGGEEEILCRLFDLTADNPRVIFGGFTGLGWKKVDEPAMRDLHLRMNDYYTWRVRGSRYKE